MPKSISVSLSDYRGRNASVIVRVPDSETVDEAVAYAQAMVQELDAITGARVESVDIIVPVTVTGIKTGAVADVANENGANFNYSLQSSPYSETIRIPAILPALLAGDSVNTANADVNAFNVAIVAGAAGRPGAVNEFGNKLTGLNSAKRTFRRK